ncbi:hypothetical protein LCL95_09920 [Bacillus timonensis]|nr:hypothetical protein [Bacillus timonensis]
MSKNYTTVRIDNETMKKLEEIAETMEFQLNFKISKSSALRHVVESEYKQIVENPRKLAQRLLNKEGSKGDD